jgi:acyl carrier protein
MQNDVKTHPQGPRDIPTEVEIQEWLTSYLSELLGVDSEEIQIDETVASFGLDSSAAAGLVGDLSIWLDRKLDPELVYNYPTIESLSRFLVSTEG